MPLWEHLQRQPAFGMGGNLLLQALQELEFMEWRLRHRVTTYGRQFVSLSTTGTNIYGETAALTGVNHGGVFLSASTEGYGVKGEATAGTGITRGSLFTSYSADGVGVYGQG